MKKRALAIVMSAALVGVLLPMGVLAAADESPEGEEIFVGEVIDEEEGIFVGEVIEEEESVIEKDASSDSQEEDDTVDVEIDSLDETSGDSEEDVVSDIEEEDGIENGIAFLSAMPEEEEPEDEEDSIQTYAEMPDAENGVITLSESIALDETYVVDGETLTINLNGYTLSLDEGVDGSVIEVINSGNLTINGAGTITGGDGDEIDDSAGAHREGGGIHVEDSTLTLNGVTVANNYSVDYEGGGVYATGSTLTISGCTISNNSSILHDGANPNDNNHENGGGVFAYECYVTISNTRFSNNESNYGGGLEIENCYNTAITNCVFEGNTAHAYGGALHIWAESEAGVVTVEGCTFTGNTAGSYGGAVNVNGSGGETVTFTGCTFSGNSTELYGGGVAVGNTVSVEFDNCDFIENDASGQSYGYGGGLYFVNYGEGTTQINDCTFDGNSSDYEGGGICIWETNSTGQADFSITDCIIVNNSSRYGGGIISYLPNDHSLTISDTEISGNYASANGGGIYLYKGATNMKEGSVVANNTSDTSSGGGMYVYQSALTINDDCIVANNTSNTGAADIYKSSSGSLSFFNAAEMNTVYEADGKNQKIDGWYADLPDARYKPSADGVAYTEFELGTGTTYYLIASYAADVYEVTFLPGEEGTLDGETEFYVAGGKTMEDYDGYGVPTVIPDDGYAFDHWEAAIVEEGLSTYAVTYGEEVVDGGEYEYADPAALTISSDVTFTAYYTPVEEVTDEDEDNDLDDDDGADADNENLDDDDGADADNENLDDGKGADADNEDLDDGNIVSDVDEITDDDLTSTEAVKTSDPNRVGMWLALLMTAGGLFAVSGVLLRQKSSGVRK